LSIFLSLFKAANNLQVKYYDYPKALRKTINAKSSMLKTERVGAFGASSKLKAESSKGKRGVIFPIEKKLNPLTN
jgi:hypothetical protein